MAGSGRRAAMGLAVAVCCAAFAADADDYPSRPVRLVVGFPPGASADITARVLGSRMSQRLGQQMVIENKPGAGSSLAAELVTRAPKDGYTLFLGSSANITNQVMSAHVGFDMAKDFAPVARAATAAVILVVHPSTGVHSVQELIALAKAKPGEILYASTGVGTAPHLSAELFGQRAGVKLVHVPYQGSPQAATDLLAGRVHMMFSPASAVMAQVEAHARPRAQRRGEVGRGDREAQGPRLRAAWRHPGGAGKLHRDGDAQMVGRRPGGGIEEVMGSGTKEHFFWDLYTCLTQPKNGCRITPQ